MRLPWGDAFIVRPGVVGFSGCKLNFPWAIVNPLWGKLNFPWGIGNSPWEKLDFPWGIVYSPRGELNIPRGIVDPDQGRFVPLEGRLNHRFSIRLRHATPPALFDFSTMGVMAAWAAQSVAP